MPVRVGGGGGGGGGLGVGKGRTGHWYGELASAREV